MYPTLKTHCSGASWSDLAAATKFSSTPQLKITLSKKITSLSLTMFSLLKKRYKHYTICTGILTVWKMTSNYIFELDLQTN